METLESIKALTIDYLVNTAQLPAEDVADGKTKLGSLNIDSLSLVELLWTLENEYGVTIRDIAQLRQMSIDEMVAHLAGLLDQVGPGPALRAP